MHTNTMENLKMIADTARDFAEINIRPHIMEWDENQFFPKELFHQLGEMGFMGIIIPEEYGGSGLGYHEYVAIIDQISQVDPSIGLSIAAHNSLCTNHIYEFGTEEQRKKWLPQLASGQVIGAWGLTEHNTGSDAGGMSTTAIKDGNEWIINGAKNFITHAISGDIAVVMTRTGEKGTSNNSTAFVLEKGMPGFTSGKKENKLGMRASETAELIFDNVRVPDSHRLGEIGTLTLSKISSAVSEARIPSLFSFFPEEKPSIPFSSTNAVELLDVPFSPVLVITTAISPDIA